MTETKQVSNKEFLMAVFRDDATRAWVAGFGGDPYKAGPKWKGAPAGTPEGKRAWTNPAQNTFYAISVFNPGEDGQWRRAKDLFDACYVIMIDDVGDKVPEFRLDLHAPGLEPSFAIETSPGNCQWGFILEAPERRAWAVEQLQDGLVALEIAEGGLDPGMKGVTRYARLPEGQNEKPKHIEANGGRPWKHRVRTWAPERKFTVDGLAELFGIKLVDPGEESFEKAERPVGNWPEDPVRETLDKLGLLRRPADRDHNGFDMECPWINEHTDRAEEGTIYFRRGSVDLAGRAYPDGGFKCHHGHCESRTVRDLWNWLEEQGHPVRRSPEEAFAGLLGGASTEADIVAAMHQAEPKDSSGRLPASELRSQLDRADNGGIYKSLENARAILSRDAGIPPIEFNRFYGHKTFGRRKWEDLFDVNLVYYIIERYGVEFPKAKIIDAAAQVAGENAFDPVAEYLDATAWDGTKRLDTWLVDYAGVADTAYTREAGRKILLAAVARTYAPGTKFDHMLILEGPQGAGKSSLLANLCPNPDWFTDSHLSIGSGRQRDAAEMLRGKWIIEMAELSSLKRSEVEPLKAFLSAQYDDYRPSYGRETVQYPRRCVFFGTTNEAQYLHDATGARRFWPVRVCETRAMRFTDVPAVRDQLWAEAVAAYRAGESLELGAMARIQAAEAAEERYDEDDWGAVIDVYLANYPEIRFISGHALAFGALNVPHDKLDRGAQKRISDVMTKRGWKKNTHRLTDPATGKKQAVPTRGYVNPAVELTDASAAATDKLHESLGLLTPDGSTLLN